MYKTPLIGALLWAVLLTPQALADITIERRYADPYGSDHRRIHPRVEVPPAHYRPRGYGELDRDERLRKHQAYLYERQRQQMERLYERDRARAERDSRHARGLRPEGRHTPPSRGYRVAPHGFQMPRHGLQTPRHGVQIPRHGAWTQPQSRQHFERRRPSEAGQHRRAPQTFFNR